MKRNFPWAVFVCIITACITYNPTCGTAWGGVVVRIAQPPLQSATLKAIGKKSACAIAIDVKTGQILAMAENKVRCTDAYPPGSIIKLLSAYAALEEGVISPDTKIECRNFHKTGNKTLICSKPGGHGKVDMETAIAKSCNVYFYTIGERLGPDRLLKYFHTFGLGKDFNGQINYLDIIFLVYLFIYYQQYKSFVEVHK